MGSNPGHGEVVFCISFFLLLHYILHQGSSTLSVCSVCPSLRCNTTVGSTPSNGKKLKI